MGGYKWQYGTISLYAFEIVLLAWLVSLFLSSQFFFSVIAILRSNLSLLSMLGLPRSPRRALRNDKDKGSLEKRGLVLPFKRWENFGKASIIFFLLWIFASFLWASDRALSLSYAGVFLLGAGLVWSVRAGHIHFRKTVWVFLLSLFFHAVLGIGQYLFQASPPVSFLGMSEHRPEVADTAVLKIESERVLRAYGGMTHPNVLAGALAVGILLALWSWITARSLAESAGASVFVFISLLTLLLTFSRSAWLGFLLGFLVFFLWLFVRKKDWRPRTIPIFLLALSAMGVYAFALRDTITSRFDGDTIAVEGSVRDRSELARDAVSVWKEHLFLGVGVGSSTLAMMQKDFGESVLSQTIPVWDYQPAHCVALLVLVELGSVGLIASTGLFVLIVVLGVSALWRAPMRDMAVVSSFIAVLPIAFLDHWLWTSHFGILFFCLLAGWLFIQEEKKLSEFNSEK